MLRDEYNYGCKKFCIPYWDALNVYLNRDISFINGKKKKSFQYCIVYCCLSRNNKHKIPSYPGEHVEKISSHYIPTQMQNENITPIPKLNKQYDANGNGVAWIFVRWRAVF